MSGVVACLQRDCAVILEELRQWQDAAMLFEKAGAFEKAAEIHINTKNFGQVRPRN
jgi:WD repeat-containing protein 19